MSKRKTKKEVVKSVFRAKLGLIDRILYARNTEIKKVESSFEERSFLDSNHLMGYTPSTTAWGLFYNDRLVFICTFGHIRFSSESGHELIRLCTQKNTVVVGGFSRLMKHHVNQTNPTRIISYADRRWSSLKTNTYQHIGFDHVKTSKPGYWYFTTYPLKRYHRSNFTKQTLINKYDADPTKTEFENMVNMGYDRIWDCGQLKFQWNIKNGPRPDKKP